MHTRSIVIVLAVAFAAVGCLGAASEEPAATRSAGFRPVGTDTLTEGSPAIPALEGRAGFGPVEITNPDDFGGEPGVDVAPDGTVYVNAPSGLGGGTGSWLYRKEADGSWRDCMTTTGPGGGDSNVAINPWGRIAMNDLWLGSLTFYQDEKSRCEFWLANPVTTPVPVGDRQWIDWGWADCEYFQSWTQIPTGIHLQYTKDCGITWTDVTVAATVDLIGNLVVDHSGKTRNAYQVYAAGGQIKLAVVTLANSAVTPSFIVQTKTVAFGGTNHNVADSFPVLDVDAAGNLHVVWQDLYRQGQGQSATYDSTIRYAYSANNGVTWSAQRTLNNVGTSGVFPWIAAGGAGKAVAVWYQADEKGDPNRIDGPWFVQTSRVLTLGGAFAQDRATPLSIHNDVICTSGTGCGGDDRDLLDFFEVDIALDGYAAIAFTKDTDAAGNGNGDPRNAYVKQTSGDPLL